MNEHTPAALVERPISRAGLSRRPPPTSTWRYHGAARSRRPLWCALVVSAVLHLGVLLGFNRHTPPPRRVEAGDAIAVTIVMPDLKDLEEPEPQPTDNENPVDAGITVPTLADVPSQVDLSTAFVQEIDYSTLLPQPDVSAAKTLSIPTHISHGKIGEGMGKIFELKDLDRPPEPLVRISPIFPAALKQQGMRAEVMVGFITDSNGLVKNAYIVESTDHRFEDAALVAIGKWKFRPGIRNGKRVAVRMMQPLKFFVHGNDGE